jgi:hypothetical protein
VDAILQGDEGAAAGAQGHRANDAGYLPAVVVSGGQVVAVDALAENVDGVERLFLDIPNGAFADTAMRRIETGNFHGEFSWLALVSSRVMRATSRLNKVTARSWVVGMMRGFGVWSMMRCKR